MLMGTLVVNVLCLLGALLALQRLRRPTAPADPPGSFAQALAVSLPLAREKDAVPTHSVPEPLRCLGRRLRRAATEEAVPRAGLALEAVRATNRPHELQGKRTC